MIFLISGKMRSGKDTAANIIKEEIPGTCIARNAGMLKWMASEYLGWDGNKGEGGRTLLQFLGTDLTRNKLELPDFWIDGLLAQLPVLKFYFNHFAIPDVRFPNEIEKIKSVYGDEAVSIRIERSLGRNEEELINVNHPSETALDDYEFDHTIYNDGSMEQLREILLSIIYIEKNKNKNN